MITLYKCRLCFFAYTNIISVTFLQVPVLSFHHPMTTQHLRKMDLYSTALEMERFLCGQWMDMLLAHHMYSIKEYNTHPPLLPDKLTVSSQLIVPTTKANNVTVICTLLDSVFNFQSSKPVKLYLQGAAYIICIHVLF